ncbi:DUF2147 domain-containing protein [Methylobacterium persicinum]|uniref:Uncharacterized protein (DUF2147 family) n=1 Tax=Methylobacterium persicinum TaxID=374426 RepID=A0ABU0HQK8_9HYPH|nr:DUF2147 domain-containing protein [Methylobacterium persicinum]MDQ0443995.1 uncharacterized protein (DUF2147 family) [Methylobacterium persicinum]GJE38456.1 hypothetical protein KHHGKMAE_2528 [Methylobacterium persicinum]
MMFRTLGRRAAPFALLALAAIAAPARAATPTDPSGTYLTEDGRARVRLERCGAANDRLCGYVVWLKVPLNDKGEPRTDFKNPDPKKQARPSLGHQLIMGLKPNDDAHYEGQIYNSEDGKFYKVTIWTDAPGELTVKGCLIAFLCKSQTWTKVSDLVPGQLGGPTNGPNGPRTDPEYMGKPPAAPKPGAKASGKPAAPAAGAAPAAPAADE